MTLCGPRTKMKHIGRADLSTVREIPDCSPQGANYGAPRVLQACSIVSFRYNVIGKLGYE